MKTKDFLLVAQKLIETNLFIVLEKGKHGNLGGSCIGRTDLQNAKLWRSWGTLENIVIFKTAKEVNKILLNHNITEFVAKETKSGKMSRLILS